MTNTLPPSDAKLELSLLANLYFNKDDKDFVNYFFTQIKEEDFYSSRYKQAFNILFDDYRVFGEVDFSKLDRPSEYVERLEEYNTPAINKRKIKELKDITKRRKLWRIATTILEKKDVPPKEMIGATIAALTMVGKSHEDSPKKASDILSSVRMSWEKVKGKTVIGTPSHSFVDEYIYGYQPAHYWVIGAYTNYGKSTLASWLVSKLLEGREPVCFFSTEMTKEQTLEKIMSQYFKDSLWQIRNHPERYALEVIEQSSLHIYDDKLTVEDIQLELMAMKIQGILPKVVFVDFIQNIQSSEKTIYEKLTAITLKLQQLAREVGVCIVALSQISNDGAGKPSEVLPFKGSGEIASSADFALQIIRDKKKEDPNADRVPFQVRVLKNRHGISGKSREMTLCLSNGVLLDEPTILPPKDLPWTY